MTNKSDAERSAIQPAGDAVRDAGGERQKIMPSKLPQQAAIKDADWINRKTDKDTVTPSLVKQCYDIAYFCHRTSAPAAPVASAPAQAMRK